MVDSKSQGYLTEADCNDGTSKHGDDNTNSLTKESFVNICYHAVNFSESFVKTSFQIALCIGRMNCQGIVGRVGRKAGKKWLIAVRFNKLNFIKPLLIELH